ncbi:MAG: type II toxin-antitoxin system death-on-curing family toxin [Sphingomicrobium sp.]
MSDWEWIGSAVAVSIHDRQLAEYGGPAGLRNAAGLKSALARPLNLCAYGEPDMAELAAAYAVGIARNHPFVDGNKRTAWVIARTFIRLNGGKLRFEEVDAIGTMLALAAGDLDEETLADWFRARMSTS